MINVRLSRALVLATALCATAVRGAEVAPAPEHVDFFEQEVRPLLVRECYECHSAQSKILQGGLHLDSRPGWQKGGDSGEVIVRTIRSDLRMDYTAVGQTTHLASRMEQLADPGRILLTPGTLALAEGFIRPIPAEQRPPSFDLILSRVDMQQGDFDAAIAASQAVLDAADIEPAQRDLAERDGEPEQHAARGEREQRATGG